MREDAMQQDQQLERMSSNSRGAGGARDEVEMNSYERDLTEPEWSSWAICGMVVTVRPTETLDLRSPAGSPRFSPEIVLKKYLDDSTGKLPSRRVLARRESEFIPCLRFSKPVAYEIAHRYASDFRAIVSAREMNDPFLGEETVVLPLDANLAGDAPILYSALNSLPRHILEYILEDPDFLSLKLGTHDIVGQEYWLKQVPLWQTAMNNPALRLAANYLRESILSWLPDMERWMANGYSLEYDEPMEVARSEQAHWNAFKAIEAIIGDPGKDRTGKRLRERMTTRGIDLQAPWGTSDSGDIADAVIATMGLRDPIAAHGCGKDKRPLRAGELLDAQSLAHAILVRAVSAAEELGASVNNL
jgi:hypothetical protein